MLIPYPEWEHSNRRSSRYTDPGMFKGIQCHGSVVETTGVNKVYNFFKLACIVMSDNVSTVIF